MKKIFYLIIPILIIFSVFYFSDISFDDFLAQLSQGYTTGGDSALFDLDDKYGFPENTDNFDITIEPEKYKLYSLNINAGNNDGIIRDTFKFAFKGTDTPQEVINIEMELDSEGRIIRDITGYALKGQSLDLVVRQNYDEQGNSYAENMTYMNNHSNNAISVDTRRISGAPRLRADASGLGAPIDDRNERAMSIIGVNDTDKVYWDDGWKFSTKYSFSWFRMFLMHNATEKITLTLNGDVRLETEYTFHYKTGLLEKKTVSYYYDDESPPDIVMVYKLDNQGGLISATYDIDEDGSIDYTRDFKSI